MYDRWGEAKWLDYLQRLAAQEPKYGRYMQAQPANGIELAAMARRLSGLFHGQPGARAFRRYLSEPTLNQRTGADVLRAALGFTRASCQPARAA